ncbi:protein kintoun [Scophthalmus maximus]|uniref:protein kintoun n=1 Tax=Scophthalmus maximus TaxID=52904 RepID=UPI001FA91312|nr:protein kintoun [Scophthalmus maximus]
MEVGESQGELNMTAEEVDRLRKALKDETFREMLRDYAEEISDPENKRRYEEEIKLLERERGNSVEFIHPGPCRALRTSVNGKQKCFINICANDKIGKPECKCGVSEDGRRGQCWSLPHSLHPGRQDTEPKGNQIVIYDVIFHPDTLHIASKNKRFMDLVDSTAIKGIQDAFKVTLDKNNVRQLNTKYKGTPQPCVIRKPIAGHGAKQPSEEPDPLAFPYPEEKRPTTPLQTKPGTPQSFQIQPQESKEPTKPNYTVKYRSFVDLQDFRCSRDSARGPRPKEIVVTINVPLLKSIRDTSLEVEEKRLLLESKKPAYRLELPLAYPVDEDKGEAKFNKQRGQLTVTLPVLPSNEGCDFSTGPALTVVDAQRVGDDEGKGMENEEDEWKELERGSERGVEQEKVKQDRGDEDEDLEKGGEDEERQEQVRKGAEGEESVVGEEEKWRKPKRGGESDEGGSGVDKEANLMEPNRKVQESVKEERGVEEISEISEIGVKEKLKEQKQENENDGKLTETQSILLNEHLCGTREEVEVNPHSCLELTSKTETSDVHMETEETKEKTEENVQLEADVVSRNCASSEESPAMTTASSHGVVEDCSTSQRTDIASATAEANVSGGGVPASGQQGDGEEVDEDDLPTEQIFPTQEGEDKPPPALLREIGKDEKETVISDHSTSAGFTFQNSLMYELD